jgi:hypothetical protein
MRLSHRFVRSDQGILAEASKFLAILHTFLQNAEIIFIHEFPVASIPGYFVEDIALNHLLDQTTGGSMGNPGYSADFVDGDQRVQEKLINQFQAIRYVSEPGPILLLQGNDPLGRFCCLVGYLVYTLKEELDPTFPITFVSDVVQTIIVLLAVFLEKVPYFHR